MNQIIRKIITIMTLIIIAFSLITNQVGGQAELRVPVSLYMNSTLVNNDYSPLVSDGQILLPARIISQFLGYYLYYNSAYEEIKITDVDLTSQCIIQSAPPLPLNTENVGAVLETVKEIDVDTLLQNEPTYLPTYNEPSANVTIVMHLGDTTAYVNGKPIKLEAAPQLINGKTYLPDQFIIEQLGCAVTYDDYYFAVKIENPKIKVAKPLQKSLNYTMDEFYLLSKLIEVEARNQPIECRIGIANVVLNRLKSPQFPNSITAIIYDQTWATQFPPVFKPIFKELVPSLTSRQAAKIALEGYNNIDNCLYYNHRVFTNKEVVYKIGGEYFMR